MKFEVFFFGKGDKNQYKGDKKWMASWMHGPKIEEKGLFGHWADISIGFWTENRTLRHVSGHKYRVLTQNRSAKRIFEEKGLFGHWADISIGFWTKKWPIPKI